MCSDMNLDARGGVWLDQPLVALALVIVLLGAFVYLDPEPGSGWHGDWRQFPQRLLDGFRGVRVILQRTGQVRVVGSHVEVAVARQVEQDHASLAGLAG